MLVRLKDGTVIKRIAAIWIEDDYIQLSKCLETIREVHVFEKIAKTHIDGIYDNIRAIPL